MKMIFQILIGALEGPLLEYGTDGLDKWLEDQYAKFPNRTAMFVSIGHAMLKEGALDLVKKTNTRIDDDVVNAAISEFESFAQKHNFTLADFSNLDIPASPDTGAGENTSGEPGV